MNEIQNKRIILIEDSLDDIELIKIALKSSLDIDEIQVFRDGEKFIEFLSPENMHSLQSSQVSIALIILDLQIPEISAMEVLKQIRKHKVTKVTPVVIFSSSGEEKDIQSSYKYGANSYVRKPVDAVKFEEVVRIMTNYWLNFNKIDLGVLI